MKKIDEKLNRACPYIIVSEIRKNEHKGLYQSTLLGVIMGL